MPEIGQGWARQASDSGFEYFWMEVESNGIGCKGCSYLSKANWQKLEVLELSNSSRIRRQQDWAERVVVPDQAPVALPADNGTQF